MSCSKNCSNLSEQWTTKPYFCIWYYSFILNIKHIVQVFRTASTETEAVMPKAPSRPLNKSTTKDVRRSGNYKYRIDELNDPPVRHPGIRSLLPLPGGDLLTGGTDLKIRYWDQARFSFICTPLLHHYFPPPADIMIFLLLPILKTWAKLLHCWSISQRSLFSKRRYFGEGGWKRWVLWYKIQFWSTSRAGNPLSLLVSSFV